MLPKLVDTILALAIVAFAWIGIIQAIIIRRQKKEINKLKNDCSEKRSALPTK